MKWSEELVQAGSIGLRLYLLKGKGFHLVGHFPKKKKNETNFYFFFLPLGPKISFTTRHNTVDWMRSLRRGNIAAIASLAFSNSIIKILSGEDPPRVAPELVFGAGMVAPK